MRYSPALARAGLAKPSSDKAAKTTSDETLIGLIAAQDKDAMRLLFARHHVRVFRFLHRLINNEATAEELVTEVFLDVWRNAASFEGRAQVATWILGIARFKALTALRRRTLDEIDEEAVEAIEDMADTPEATCQKIQRGAILQDCLKQLSPAHREVVDLIYYHEQSIDEAARIIGIPENTVKTRVFHARKRLAELMAARGLDRASL
jgi:RNA polymerase sigma-70 factor (ECF subfamily)